MSMFRQCPDEGVAEYFEQLAGSDGRNRNGRSTCPRKFEFSSCAGGINT